MISLRSIRKAYPARRQTSRSRVRLGIERLDDRIVPSTIPNLTNAHFDLNLGNHTAQMVVTSEDPTTGKFSGNFNDPTASVSVQVNGTVTAASVGNLTFSGLLPVLSAKSFTFYGVSFEGTINGFGTDGKFYGGDFLYGSATEHPWSGPAVSYTVTGNDYAPPTPPSTPTYIGSGVLSASVAFDTAGQEWQAVVFTSGQLWIYGPSTTQYIGSGVASASIAFTASGQEVDYIVFAGNNLYSYDAAGSHFIGSGVQSASVTFDPADGQQVTAIVYTGGAMYVQFGAGGTPVSMAANVQSVSMAFTSGISLESVRVDPDGTAAVYTDSGTQSIGGGIQSVGLGFNDLAQNDTNQRVLDVVFASGDLWQF